jgi:iron(III) transport system permease protein
MHTDSLPRCFAWRRTERGWGWLFGAALIALTVLAPLAALGWWALHADMAQWSHLSRYVIPQALSNTIILLLGVSVRVTLLGTGAAWLVTAYDFPSRGVLTWALLLPLAMPTYIIAFAYLDGRASPHRPGANRDSRATGV